jgi:hypothetical protein
MVDLWLKALFFYQKNVVIVEFQSKMGWNLVGVAYWIENLQSIGVSCIVEINQPSSLASLRNGIKHHKAHPYIWAKMDSYWIFYLNEM